MDGCAPILMVKAGCWRVYCCFFGGAQGEGTFWNIMESWTGFYEVKNPACSCVLFGTSMDVKVGFQTFSRFMSFEGEVCWIDWDEFVFFLQIENPKLMMFHHKEFKNTHLLAYPNSVYTVYHWVSGWWFQISFIFNPIWGRFPIWLIFFKWVETTNQVYIGSFFNSSLHAFQKRGALATPWFKMPRPETGTVQMVWLFVVCLFFLEGSGFCMVLPVMIWG